MNKLIETKENQCHKNFNVQTSRAIIQYKH